MIERLLEYWAPEAIEPVVVRVRIGAPEPTPEGNYQATLSIEGLDAPYAAPFEQVDALGAVLAAAAIAPSTLFMLTDGVGRLTWLGGEDLGFPLLTPPKHYWAFRPANGGEPQPLSISIAPPQKIGARWGCLITFVAPEVCEERWIHGETWARALEASAAAVPAMLQDFTDKAGGGSIEDWPLP